MQFWTSSQTSSILSSHGLIVFCFLLSSYLCTTLTVDVLPVHITLQEFLLNWRKAVSQKFFSRKIIVLYRKKWRRKRRTNKMAWPDLWLWEHFPISFLWKKGFSFSLKNQTTLLSTYSSLSNISLMLHSVDSLIKGISPLACHWSCVSFSFHFRWHFWKQESHIPFKCITIRTINSFLSTCFTAQRKKKLQTVFSLLKIVSTNWTGLNSQ